MNNLKIQQMFLNSLDDYCHIYHPSEVQMKATLSIMNCKSGKLSKNASMFPDCDHVEFHSNSTNCQAALKDV